MNRHPDIVNELASISPAVANLDPTLPLSVPEGYFESLPDKILQRVRDLETPKGELEALSPLLAGMTKKDPFAVPEGYFESLASQISMKAGGAGEPVAAEKPVETARVVAFSTLRNWTRYAAAAVITAAIAGSALYFFRADESEAPGQEKLVASKTDGGQKDTLPVSEEALIGFLDETETLPGDDILFSTEPLDSLVPKDLAILELNEKRITEILEEIPDAALKAYVDENPDPGKTGSTN
jgi:hypothetical protein